MKKLPDILQSKLEIFNDEINLRLKEFKTIQPELIFYEFCFCILTPQSSAQNAMEVQKILINNNFLHHHFNPIEILADKKHYIRFHNQKSQRLIKAIDYYPRLNTVLTSDTNVYEKRKIIKDEFSGIGMKESSHFLRNIGYKNLAIIDRHILRALEFCGVIESINPPKNEKQYIAIEKKFYEYSLEIGIDMDVLDLLFFAHATGLVLK